MATGKKLMEEKWYKDFSFMHFQFVREVKKKAKMSRKSNKKVVVFADTESCKHSVSNKETGSCISFILK